MVVALKMGLSAGEFARQCLDNIRGHAWLFGNNQCFSHDCQEMARLDETMNESLQALVPAVRLIEVTGVRRAGQDYPRGAADVL